MSGHRPLAVLFDLDGTLIDTIDLLLESVRHAFRGRPHAPTDDEWRAGIGTPLAAQLRPYAADDRDLGLLVDGYRTYQSEHHDRLTRCYDDVVATVQGLRERGHPLGIVTSKADDVARRSLEHVGLMRYMRVLVGVNASTRHKPDPEPVRVALDRLGYAPRDAVFLGDSPHDVLAGNGAGVITVAALWGFFTRAMLEPAEPAYYIERPTDLVPLIDRLEAERGDRGRTATAASLP